MNSLILAIQFLTRIPVPVRSTFNEKEAGKSLFWFPWISLVMGLIVGYAHELTFDGYPILSAFLSLAVMYALSGAIHLDGLMDTADGFLAGKDTERTIEIMHDSKIGTYAVVSVLFVLLGNYSVFASVPMGAVEVGILFASARMGILTVIHFFPAIKASTLGTLFKRRAVKRVYGLQWVLLVALILILRDARFLVFPGVSIVFAVLFGRHALKKIGGVSGDIFGAVMELEQWILLLLYGGFYSWLFI
ncbi:MAG: adenosylcobinamide-GDP ribazoletransferase [Peptoniphilus sp.]|nr:adenosylcobinamide-GDP ribazoletransferase [Peptoniphilus sp.]MDD7363727.1 adenosylcobinamide-GDP ribazoletransferase [Bacillota bacterium]MDY6044112.1 adenosylcobinamide-GDP ribazoletransferase [Peptoniphilus sp.]